MDKMTMWVAFLLFENKENTTFKTLDMIRLKKQYLIPLYLWLQWLQRILLYTLDLSMHCSFFLGEENV